MASHASRVPVQRDLIADLSEQRGFLRSSAAAYDAGNEPEAKRLALTLRLFLHDPRNQRSLLTRMGVRDRLPWTDTSHGEPPPGAMFFAAGLATMRIAGGTVTYFAPLDDVDPLRFQPAQAFADWWSESIMRDSVGNNFSRSDLVLSVADQDGGAHIDERLNAAYAALTRNNSLGFAVSSSDTDGTTGIAFGPGATGQPFSNSVALANVREIAWEVENCGRRLNTGPPAPVEKWTTWR
jgi:hypothetical protein